MTVRGRGVHPGRPRSAEAEAAILDATLELLAEQGLGALSIEAVATRAGVGKATIYRRWPSRDDVVAAAFQSITSRIDVPDTGSVRDDLITLLLGFRTQTFRALPGGLISRLIAATSSNPELLQLFLANTFAPRRAAVLQVLERASARGDLRPGVDLHLAFMMIVGPILGSALLDPGSLSADLPGALVDTLLEGIAAR